MATKAEILAKTFLRREWNKLTGRERKVIESFINREQSKEER